MKNILQRLILIPLLFKFFFVNIFLALVYPSVFHQVITFNLFKKIKIVKQYGFFVINQLIIYFLND